jgi:hypothetical protein
MLVGRRHALAHDKILRVARTIVRTTEIADGVRQRKIIWEMSAEANGSW